MKTYVISNPSKQHADVFYRLVSDRLVQVSVPFGGQTEIPVPEDGKNFIADLDLQCRALGLKSKEK